MDYCVLGTSGLEVSRIGFGCAAIGGYDYGTVDDDESRRAVRAALDVGITFFDTADVYGFGHAEEILSRALGPDRHRVVIATKGGVQWSAGGRTRRDLGRTALQQALDDSLRRLRVDCIALYQVHWPDGRTPLEEVGASLADFIRAGKVRYAGVCNMSLEEFAQVRAACPLVSLQLPLSCSDRENLAVISAVRSAYGASAIAYNVLAQGFFSGKYSSQSNFDGSDLRARSNLFRGKSLARNERLLDALQEIAQRHGVGPAQVAVRWAIENPTVACALVGIKTEAQVRANSVASRLQLGVEDWQRIEAAYHSDVSVNSRQGSS